MRAFIANWNWLILVVAAPFLLFPSPERAWVMAVVPVVWLLAWAASGEPLPRTPLNLTLLLLFIMVLVSLHATYDVAVSLPKVSGMVLGLGAFAAVAYQGRRPAGWWGGLVVFLVVGLGVAVVGFLGTRWGAKIDGLAPLTAVLQPQIVGLPGAKAGINANEVAGALLWVLPVSLCLAVLSLTRIRAAWRALGLGTLPLLAVLWVAAAALTAVLVLTQSRSAYAGLAIALLVLIGVSLRRTGRLVYAILLSLVLVPLLWFAVQVGPGNLWNQWFGDTAGSLDVVAKLSGREVIWHSALQGIHDFALTGMGMNTFRGLVHVLYPLPGRFTSDIAHAHNEFLQAGLDLGVPGMIAFIALYIGAFAMLFDIWKRSSRTPVDVPGARRRASPAVGPVARALALGMGGGLLAHAIYGLTDAVALGAKPGILFWMLLGLICGLHAQSERLSWDDV